MEVVDVREALATMVADVSYPCVGAKSAFNRQGVTYHLADRLANRDETEGLYAALAQFSRDHPDPAADTDAPRLTSFVAAFRRPLPRTEVQFERLLWQQLVLLHEHDDAAWDPRVSDDPADAHFAFSVAGRAFFVIGMHPAASRLARRTPAPVLVFNLHSQFERLRASGHYARLRDTVRRRDTRLQGDINPMVSDHGRRSEACQYSGRAVPDGWQPPYDLHHTEHGGATG